jgi:N-acetylmuramoyl-L-alanine amidase
LILDNIKPDTVLLKSTHRKAGFMVLLAPDVPAILFEMGFLTNPQDEAQLNSQAYRVKMASNIAKAIDQYFSADVRHASFGILN